MYKQIVLIVCIVLIVVGSSGCTTNEENNQTVDTEWSRFVGTWIYEYQRLHYEPVNKTMILFSDGTCVSDFGTYYKIKDGKLVFSIYMEGNYIQTPYVYSFSNNDTILHITQVGAEITYVLYKQ